MYFLEKTVFSSYSYILQVHMIQRFMIKPSSSSIYISFGTLSISPLLNYLYYSKYISYSHLQLHL